MQEAVRAGDGPGYLAHVVQADGPLGDACFRQEQVGLAGDFAKRPVRDFELSVDDTPMALADLSVPKEQQWPTTPPKLTPTRAEVRLTMAWTPAGERPANEDKGAGPGGGGGGEGAKVGPSRRLSLPVVFVRAGPGERWLYAGERWATHVREADAAIEFAGTLVRFAEGDKLQAKEASIIAAQMPRIRKEIDGHFGVRVGRVQEVKLYRSMTHLQASIWLNYTDALAGWNEPGESIKVLISHATVRKLLEFVAHEYGHVASFELGPRATEAPWWALEGCAELASAPFRTDAKAKRDRRVLAWFSAGNLAPWEAISPFPLAPEHERYSRHVYTQGEHVLAFISERFGIPAYRAFLRELTSGKGTDQASVAALLKPWAEVDRLWREDLAAQAKATGTPKDDAPAPDDDEAPAGGPGEPRGPGGRPAKDPAQ
jgi:hypothetical protein